MVRHESSVIHQISKDVSTEVAYYRFFKNKEVLMPEMISHIVAPLAERVDNRHVLLISDSTEISLKSQVKHIVDSSIRKSCDTWSSLWFGCNLLFD